MTIRWLLMLLLVPSGLASTEAEVPLTANLETKLLPSDGEVSDWAGTSVAISGNTALVGAPGDDDNGANAGSVYVFVWNHGLWTEYAKLLPSDGQAGDYFGGSVAISGNIAIIGAYRDDDNGTDSGSAYVFVRTHGVWVEQVKLLASDGEPRDAFGGSVSISGDTVLLGAPLDDDDGIDSGSAYVFVQTGSSWAEEAKLRASQGMKEDIFGVSVSVAGNAALIGAYLADGNGIDSGKAYIFERSHGVWSEQAELLPSEVGAGDAFGYSVSLSGNTALVGSAGDDEVGTLAGAAYVFVHHRGWKQQAKLLPSGGEAYDRFGWSVSISGNQALAGAPFSDNPETGYASLFERHHGKWTERAKLVPTDTRASRWNLLTLSLEAPLTVMR